jgi:hypothetical protein
MMRQVCNRQGHLNNPLRAILFIAAVLLFIFTVVYRMFKSDSIRAAMATLVESLLMVAFFIFLGMVIAYLLYVIHDRFRRGPKSDPVSGLFADSVVDPESSDKADHADIGFESEEKAESQPNP